MYIKNQGKLFDDALDLHKGLELLQGFVQNEREVSDVELLAAKENVKSHIEAVKLWWGSVTSNLTEEPTVTKRKHTPIDESDNDLPF